MFVALDQAQKEYLGFGTGVSFLYSYYKHLHLLYLNILFKSLNVIRPPVSFSGVIVSRKKKPFGRTLLGY